MAQTRSRAARATALGVAATLISGGAAGLTMGHGLLLSKMGAAASVLAGLLFLRRARSRP
jgi:hypothetical protein